MGLRSQNNPIASFRDVFSATGKDAVGPPPPPQLTATGGVISDYVVGSDVYRAHVFTSSGAFDIQTLGSTSTVDITAVAGGGGGSGSLTGYWAGCGGGGGGMIEVSDYPISNLTYPIVVGGGGLGSGPQEPGVIGRTGSDSRFNNPANNSIDVVSRGGGGGGASSNSPDNFVRDNTGGGSCGGVGSKSGLNPLSGPAINTHPNNPTIAALAGVTFNHYGNVGGTGDDSTVGEGAGGGGAGGAGTGVSSPKSTTHNNPGGAGRANTYAYGPTSSITFSAGGGAGPTAGNGDPAASNTGGGGGGGANPTGAEPGGTGGSGMVIVRYKIGALEATAKATGGAISFYNGKTIHTFVASGTFVTPGSFNETVEYVVVGGGGGSGYNVGGGGGAGAYRTGTQAVSGSRTSTVTIGAGGGGAFQELNASGDTSGKPGGNTALDFASIINSPGGGGGGGRDGSPAGAYAPGNLGASGGGGAGGNGSHPGGAGGSYGYPGGAGGPYPNAGGGGGGVGGVGADRSGTTGGKGGDGNQLPSTFRDPRQAPSNTTNPQPTLRGGGLGTPGPAGGYYFAGGGGGAGVGSGPGGDGGAGGGGRGADSGSNAPVDNYGLASTGGGGGGGATSSPANGSNGGSGIVLIAYPT